MKFRSDYVDLIRSCLAEAEDWYDVERRFRERVDEEKQEEVEDATPLVVAFAYMLVASRRDESRERYGVFGAQWEMGGRIFPVPLPDVSDDMLDLWVAYADATHDFPLAASRLNDLLWVRRYGDSAIEHAHKAFAGYLALAGFAESMELVDSLLRAIEIASEIRDEERLAAAVNKAVEVVEAEIDDDQDQQRPGIPMNLLEALVNLKPDAHPDDLKRLIEDAGRRYRNDPWISQSVAELTLALSAPDEKEALQRGQVQRWKQEAEAAKGLLRYVHLDHALGLARTYGLTELANEILVAMQSMTPEDLELKRISAEVEVPREKIDAYITSYAKKSESWEEALTRFGSEGPPSGDVESNKEQTETEAEKHPLSRLFPTFVIGAHSSPTFQPANEEEHDRLDLANQEALKIGFWAPIGVEILEAIQDAFGTPSRDELTGFFTTEVIEQAVAARIADAVLRFSTGDDDGALHILVPQLEAAIRGAASRIGIVVIKTPRGPNPGGIRALGGILADFSGQMDESWRRYLVNALTDQAGINLRNQLSHGLYGPAARPDAAIAIQIACYLRLWRTKAKEEDSDGSE